MKSEFLMTKKGNTRIAPHARIFGYLQVHSALVIHHTRPKTVNRLSMVRHS